MTYGNVAVIFVVISVVFSVLALAAAGTYFLNKTVDRNG